MSPRTRKLRKIVNPPPVKGFRPYGGDSALKNSEPVYLLYEEYEALRLCDYDMLNHNQASGLMEVSRPTFTRICASGRQKMAKALVEGRQIAIEGGKVFFDSDWFHCSGCGSYFNDPHKEVVPDRCPLCKSNSVESWEPAGKRNSGDGDNIFSGTNIPTGRKDICYCPSCGEKREHQPGVPCRSEICSQCNQPMQRGGMPETGRQKRTRGGRK